jgi:hypothetical protein
MAAVSCLADFSFDRYLLFAPASMHLGRRCATQVASQEARDVGRKCILSKNPLIFAA